MKPILVLVVAVILATALPSSAAASYTPPKPTVTPLTPNSVTVGYTTPPASPSPPLAALTLAVALFIGPGNFVALPPLNLTYAALPPEAPASVVYSGLEPSSSYVYTIKANFTDGTPSTTSNPVLDTTPPPRAPDAPPTPMASALTSSSATITWADSTYAGGSPITSYSLAVSLASGPPGPPVWSASYPAPPFPSPVAIPPSTLMPFTDYLVTLTATNNVGTSPPSPPLAFATLPGPADPVDTVVLTATSHTSLSLSLLAPTTRGSDIYGYILAFDPLPSGPTVSFAFNTSLAAPPPPPGSLVNITLPYGTLAPNTTYAVSAFAAAYNAPLSAPAPPPLLLATTLPPDVPAPLACLLSFVAINASALRATWLPPYASGSPLTFYNATLTPLSAPAPPSIVTVAPTATSVVFAGLSPFTRYALSLVATNAVGPAPPPLCINATSTLPGPPAPLACPSLLPLSATSFALHFVPPSNSGSPITNYTVVYSRPSAPPTSLTLFPSTPLPYTLVLPTRHDTIALAVYASNAYGTSPSACSVSNTSFPSYPDPSPPLNVSSVTRTTAAFAWPPIEPNGDPLLAVALYVFALPLSSAPPFYNVSLDAAATTHVLPSDTLVFNTAYAAAVAGINAYGPADYLPSLVNFTSAPDVPQPPSSNSFVFDPINPRTVSLDWTPPSDSGAPISSYDIFFTEFTTAAVTTVSATAPPAIVANLDAARSYFVQISATNAVGSSPLSTPSHWTSPEATVPDAVDSASVSATPFNSSTVALAWSAPFDGGSPITAYLLRLYHAASSALVVDSSVPTPDASLTALAPDTLYHLVLAPVSSAGIGPAPSYPGQPPTFAFTTPPGIPGAPTALTLAPPPPPLSLAASATLLLAFDLPPANGAPIAAYHVVVAVNASTAPPPPPIVYNATTTLLPLLLDALDRNVVYVVRAAAANAVGLGLFSAPITAATGPDLPASPRDLALANVTATSASLAWLPPTDNGGAPVAAYTVTAASPDHSFGPIVLGPAALSAPFMALCMDATYTVNVTATNAVGASLPASATFTTAVAPPLPIPSLIAVASNATAAHLVWTPPPGVCPSLPHSYHLSYAVLGTPAGPPLSLAPSTLSAAVGGLVPGETYVFNVTIITPYGASSAVPLTLTTGSSAPDAPSVAFDAITGHLTRFNPEYVTGTYDTLAAANFALVLPAQDNGSPLTTVDVYAVPAADYAPGLALSAWPLSRNADVAGLPLGSSLFVEIDGFVLNTSYVAAAVVHNTLGASAPSPLATVDPLPGPPTAQPLPAALAPLPNSYTELTVDFAPAPAATLRGLVAVAYVAVATAAGPDGLPTKTVAALSAPSATSPIVVHGLAPSTTYWVGILAVTADDLASPLPLTSLARGATRNATVPDAPECPAVLAVVPISADALGVRFNITLPSGNGGVVATLEITLSPHNGSYAPEPVVALAAVSGLYAVVTVSAPPASAYNVSVRAANELGFGPSIGPACGASASVTTPALPPSRPAAPLVSPLSATSVAVRASSLPATNGAPLTLLNYTLVGAAGGAAAGTAYSVVVPASGLPEAIVADLLGGASYVVSLAVANTVGWSLPSFPTTVTLPAGPPLAIPCASFALTATSGTSLAFAWAPPAHDGGAPITHYAFTLVANATGTLVADGVAAPTPAYTADGLEPGTVYLASVVAVNAVGSSPSSCPSLAAATDTLAPLAPAIVSATLTSQIPATIVVVWAPAVARGTPVTGYAVAIDGAAPVALPATATSHSVDTAVYGVNRTVSVEAASAAGVSAASVAVVAVPALAPGPLGCPTVTPSTGSAVLVAWTPPPTYGAAIETYYAEYAVAPALSVWLQAPSVPAPATSMVVALAPGMSYAIRVRAVAAPGTSGTSGCAGGTPYTTAATVPATVEAVSTFPSGATSVLVTWTAPVDNGSPITEFVVLVATNAAFNPVLRAVSVVDTASRAVPTSVLVDNLEPATTYFFRVVARNALGDSGNSQSFNATTAAASPSPPALPPPPSPASPPPPLLPPGASPSDDSDSGLLFGLSDITVYVAGGVLLILICVLCWCCVRRRGRASDDANAPPPQAPAGDEEAGGGRAAGAAAAAAGAGADAGASGSRPENAADAAEAAELAEALAAIEAAEAAEAAAAAAARAAADAEAAEAAAADAAAAAAAEAAAAKQARNVTTLGSTSEAAFGVASFGAAFGDVELEPLGSGGGASGDDDDGSDGGELVDADERSDGDNASDSAVSDDGAPAALTPASFDAVFPSDGPAFGSAAFGSAAFGSAAFGSDPFGTGGGGGAPSFDAAFPAPTPAGGGEVSGGESSTLEKSRVGGGSSRASSESSVGGGGWGGGGDPWAAAVTAANTERNAGAGGGGGRRGGEGRREDASSVFTVALGDDGDASSSSSAGDGGLFSTAFAATQAPTTAVRDDSFNPFENIETSDDGLAELTAIDVTGVSGVSGVSGPAWAPSPEPEPEAAGVVVVPMVRETIKASYSEGTMTSYGLEAEVAYGVPEGSVPGGTAFTVVVGVEEGVEALDGVEMEEVDVGSLSNVVSVRPYGVGRGAWEVEVALAQAREGGRPIYRLAALRPSTAFARVPLRALLKYKVKSEADGATVLLIEVSLAVHATLAPADGTATLRVSGGLPAAGEVRSLKMKPGGRQEGRTLVWELGSESVARGSKSKLMARVIAEPGAAVDASALVLSGVYKGSGSTVWALGGSDGLGIVTGAAPGVTVAGGADAYRGVTFEFEVHGRML